MTVFKHIPSISPLLFLDLHFPCKHVGQAALVLHKKYKLPNLSAYLDEEEFASIHIGWHEERIQVHIEVHQAFDQPDSDPQKADSVELFFDTRNLKQKTTLGRFCHHFVFFPEKVDGAFGHEITRFRGDDVHMLCRSADLLVESIIQPTYTTMDITIPAQCLHGYDPVESAKIGFSYRINRKEGVSQNFSASSQEVSIEKNPSLWSTLQLIK